MPGKTLLTWICKFLHDANTSVAIICCIDNARVPCFWNPLPLASLCQIQSTQPSKSISNVLLPKNLSRLLCLFPCPAPSCKFPSPHRTSIAPLKICASFMMLSTSYLIKHLLIHFSKYLWSTYHVSGTGPHYWGHEDEEWVALQCSGSWPDLNAQTDNYSITWKNSNKGGS